MDDQELVGALAEVESERIWRLRCGEPAPGHYPVRCRRNLNHPEGHIGVGARIVSEIREKPERWESTYVVWRGRGNPVSAQVGGNGGFRCWCTLKQEPPVGSWAISEHPRLKGSLMKLGIYRHWKDNHYVALFIGRDSNNDANREDVVVYLSLSAEYAGSINVRRVSEFLEEVVLPGGGLAPRFAYVGPAPRGSEPEPRPC